jgi:DNA invertase Pin-like site-specific DNA recombinase
MTKTSTKKARISEPATNTTKADAIAANKGQRVGYIRVSSTDQNTARQLDGLRFDRTFTDQASGKNTNRPAFSEMLKFVRASDTVTVHSMDRLARNLGDLRTVVLDLTERGVKVEFVKENLTFNGDDAPMSMLLLNVMGAFAEFERALIRERQREGIDAAKARGDVYKGRKPSLTDQQVTDLKARATAGEKKAALAREFGISRETVYQHLND